MIDKDTLRQLCEYDYAPSLVGSAIRDWTGLTAEQKARRIWGIGNEQITFGEANDKG
jgi:hypothetical protein